MQTVPVVVHLRFDDGSPLLTHGLPAVLCMDVPLEQGARAAMFAAMQETLERTMKDILLQSRHA